MHPAACWTREARPGDPAPGVAPAVLRHVRLRDRLCRDVLRIGGVHGHLRPGRRDPRDRRRVRRRGRPLPDGRHRVRCRLRRARDVGRLPPWSPVRRRVPAARPVPAAFRASPHPGAGLGRRERREDDRAGAVRDRSGGLRSVRRGLVRGPTSEVLRLCGSRRWCVWATGLALLGYLVGNNVETIDRIITRIGLGGLGVAALLMGFWIWRHRRAPESRQNTPETARRTTQRRPSSDDPLRRRRSAARRTASGSRPSPCGGPPCSRHRPGAASLTAIECADR